MTKKILCVLLSILILFTFVAIPSIAFDGNDYDYGGGSDYGSWSDYGSSDSGSSSGLIDLIFYLFSGILSGNPVAIIIFIVIVIIMISLKFKSSSSGNGGTSVPGRVIPSSQGRNVYLPDRTSEIESLIKSKDQNFSSSDFISFAKEVYIDIQTAWCKRDLTPVRPVLHENLYNTTARQVQSKIDQGIIYHYESIAINTAYLTSYAKDEQFEYLTVYLNARMIDYQTDEKTGNILRGDKSTRWDLRYKMKFVRSVGSKTKDESSTHNGHNCPNCGAPLEMTSSGICDYCGSVVTTGQYTWVLTDFTTVRNDTVDEGIKS